MKITYLNPENAPTPPDGWRWKTALCKPAMGLFNPWSKNSQSYLVKAKDYDGSHADHTYITQADLPWDYFFDLDGTGLDYSDPFYRRGVERAEKDGKTIQYFSFSNPGWITVRMPIWHWNEGNYRIHQRHAADYGLSVQGDKEPTIPANLPPFPESPWNKHHWEHRGFAWKANGTRIIALVKPGENSWGVIKAEPRGAKVFYAELVPDAPAEQPDTDSPDYWRKRQDEVRMQWAQNPEMPRDYWSHAIDSWAPVVHNDWHEGTIYRPRPVALTDEQRDERDFEMWCKSSDGPASDAALGLARISFLAGRRTIREQQKGGAK